MFFKIALNYILGYVNIQVEGFYIERFINMCISKSILLWNMNRKKSSILNTNISISDLKKIRSVAKKTRCKIKINQKKGLPFIFNKYKKRKFFAVFLFLVIVILIISSNFIWNIEIRGASSIQKSEIMKILKENNLKIGVYKKKINIKNVIDDIRLKREDIAWVGIDFKGTNAVIEIVEADKKPEIVDNNEFCNIIANKEGIITKINVNNGTAIAKVGDIVKKGDILVEGKIQGKYTDPIYVHSTADIEAKVWYSEKEKAYFRQEVDEQTGNKETKYEIKFNNLQINLYKTLSNFKNYDTINENKKISLFSNFYLPIEIVKKTNYEKVKREVIYEKENLKKITMQKLDEKIKNKIEKQENIINKYVNVKEQNGFIDIELVYEVLENIGTKEKIVF